MREECAGWAREVLADPRTAILDTETTGLYGYICEICVLGRQGTLLETLVNPQAPMEAGARRVHGITDEQLADAPVFADIWPRLQALLNEHRIIIWNAEFDIGVINRELARIGEPAITPCEDAMRRYSDWYWDMPEGRYIRLNGGHRAGQDCRAVFERLGEMTADE